VIGLPFFAMLLGFPTWAALAVDASHASDAMFLTLFTAAFTVWMMFNLFDVRLHCEIRSRIAHSR
jgi:hypothetical protein